MIKNKLNVGAMKCVSGGLKELERKRAEFEAQWQKLAESCEYYCPATDLDCSHPDDSIDPVCSPLNCPYLSTTG